MSRIMIKRHHNKPHEEVVAILQEVEQSLISKFNLTTHWEGDKVLFHRSGLDGELCMEPDCVVVSMKLGMMLGLFARQIQTELESNLEKKLA